MASIEPLNSMIRSVVPGKYSRLRESWILAPDCAWKSLMVAPPFPITDPAAAFEIKNRRKDIGLTPFSVQKQNRTKMHLLYKYLTFQTVLYNKVQNYHEHQKRASDLIYWYTYMTWGFIGAISILLVQYYVQPDDEMHQNKFFTKIWHTLHCPEVQQCYIYLPYPI